MPEITNVGLNIAEKSTVIWNVADMLRGPFKPHEYGLVILPMTVIKRFHDCLLSTHEKVLAMYENIKGFEETGSHTYLYGFEESYGCLGGTYARDKDAVFASVLVCEMAAYYKEKGMTLYEALLALYEKYGYFREGVKSLTMKGLEGMERIALIMKTFRENTPAALGGFKVVVAKDYKTQVFKNLVTGEESGSPLPVSDVLHYTLEDGTWVCIRPSGTEPKLKFYIGVKADSLQAAQDKVDVLDKDIDAKIAAI